MKGLEIREQFLRYFHSKGHERVASSSLVPHNDPTLLFSNAGMNQFKDCFLGADKRPYTRATTSQKCLRISGKHNDFENVGVTARHHTFFEMLGNFSFGDYFKKEAIQYAWEFSTEIIKLDPRRIWVSIFEDDHEAEELWYKHSGLLPGRIIRLGEEENFWAMGDTGPCGPCSELHYYRGEDLDSQSEAAFKLDDGSYLEFWNLVFMQFNRDESGTLTPLPNPSIDTGSGLERVASLVQNGISNYDSDLLRPIISTCEELSGFKYDGSSFAIRDLRTDKAYARDVAMRVIADHSRAISFLLADGVQPGSDGRGYVLRRILRRAVRHGRVLEFKEPFLRETCKTVIQEMSGHYPELKEQEDIILRLAHAEETKFHETLDGGLQILHKEVEKLGSQTRVFPGDVAFVLHDTFGFPLDLTADALKAYKMTVDEKAFEKAMEGQKARSREDRRSQGIRFESIEVTCAETQFLGYELCEAEAKLVQVIQEGQGKIEPGTSLGLLFDATPFYAESGGQVGDTGYIEFSDAKFEVIDTQKLQGKYFVHTCELVSGEFSAHRVGEKARLCVDVSRRQNIRRNHSATHLVHAGLRKFLGKHVKQAGSRVDGESLRFDFSHFEPIAENTLEDILAFVNEEIRTNSEVHTRVMNVDEAKTSGAMALFGEKYGDKVRVVKIGDESLELCGGTHVQRSGDIGLVTLVSEAGVSAGVRRIECLSGEAALAQIFAERRERQHIAGLLKGDQVQLGEKLEKLLARVKSLERELEQSKAKLASRSSSDLASKFRSSPKGIKVIAECVEGVDSETLRSLVDTLRVKIGSGVVALGSTLGDSSTILVTGVTSDLAKTLHAGKLLGAVVQEFGGKGGGRPDFAQAGGVSASKLKAAVEKVYEAIG